MNALTPKVLGIALTLLPGMLPTARAQQTDQGMSMQGMDHSQMDHSQMDHSKMDHSSPSRPDAPDKRLTANPVEPIPTVTEAGRTAAFPDVHEHHLHGTTIQQYWLADRLEYADGDHGAGLDWEGLGWIGGDIQRLWLRTEGESAGDRVGRGDFEVLYGRGVRAWWDVLAGVRQDFGEGPSRTWAAFGVQGVAPYRFEVSATAYVGEGGRSAARLEAHYDMLFTNRLILQWRTEANLSGKADRELAIGPGLGTFEAGIRLRYEMMRQFAPYAGLAFSRAFGNTADLRRQAGEAVNETKFVAGLRLWF